MKNNVINKKKGELNWLKIYSIAFFVFAIILGINPVDRIAWFTDASLLIILYGFLWTTRNKFQFSNTAYTLIFIFAILNLIGASYTFAKVPIYPLMEIFGLVRNPYDRIAHFAFGFLLTLPIYELFSKTSKTKNRFWLFISPILFITALAGIYEIIEWLISDVVLAPAISKLYLGSQGDVWDAQKDLLLALVASFFSMIIIYFRRNKFSYEKQSY